MLIRQENTWPPMRRPARMTQGRLGNIAFTPASSTIVLPMQEDPRETVRQQIWQSVLIGVAVSVGTTLAMRFVDWYIFGRKS